METQRMNASALASLSATLLVTGCVNTSVPSRYAFPDALATMQRPDNASRTFYVESAKGSFSVPGEYCPRVYIAPDKSAINEVLCTAFPESFGRKTGAVPLHVVYSGDAVPGGIITVSVLVDDLDDRLAVHIPYTSLGVSPPSGTNEQEWIELRTSSGKKKKGHQYQSRILSEFIAAGVVKALNQMTPVQMEKLVARAHRTNEQRRAVDWLSGSTATTFSVSEDGCLFVESEHAFTPVPVDFAGRSKLPEISRQSFDANTRTGEITADVTGCDEDLALDYLLYRLVPEICRTKSVVFDPVMEPPRGACYKVTSHNREQHHDKDIVHISFTALQ